jgi:hypothetical protein
MTDSELLQNEEIIAMVNDEIENNTIIEEVMEDSGLTEKEFVVIQLYKYCSIQDFLNNFGESIIIYNQYHKEQIIQYKHLSSLLLQHIYYHRRSKQTYNYFRDWNFDMY